MDAETALADSAAFRSLFRRHAAGVAIVTAAVDGELVGMTVTSLISVSASPPLVAFSLSATSSATPLLRRARTAVMHLVSAEQLDLATRFATSGIDRFDGVRWERSERGDPVLAEVESWMQLRIVDSMPAATSMLVLAEVELAVGAETVRPHQPLVYWDRAWHRLGEASAL